MKPALVLLLLLTSCGDPVAPITSGVGTEACRNHGGYSGEAVWRGDMPNIRRYAICVDGERVRA